MRVSINCIEACQLSWPEPGLHVFPKQARGSPDCPQGENRRTLTGFGGAGGGIGMSRNDLETAHGYRERAEELRRIATNFRHEGSRKDLHSLAYEWDRMADRIERRQPAPGVAPTAHPPGN